MDTLEFELHARIEDNHWWFKARREIILGMLRKYLPPNEGKTIAEIGCGTGGNLKYFKKYYHVIGSDISSEAVGLASKRVDCPIFFGDFRETLSGHWKNLDGVMLVDVLEHIEEDRNFLGNVIRNLNHSSIILITIPAHPFLWSNHDVVLGHKRRYSAKSFHGLWEGFPVSELFFSTFNSFLFPIISLWRLFEIGKLKGGLKSDLTLPSQVMNRFLFQLFSLERRWLRISPIIIPGVSFLCVLKKT